MFMFVVPISWPFLLAFIAVRNTTLLGIMLFRWIFGLDRPSTLPIISKERVEPTVSRRISTEGMEQIAPGHWRPYAVGLALLLLPIVAHAQTVLVAPQGHCGFVAVDGIPNTCKAGLAYMSNVNDDKGTLMFGTRDGRAVTFVISGSRQMRPGLWYMGITAVDVVSEKGFNRARAGGICMLQTTEDPAAWVDLQCSGSATSGYFSLRFIGNGQPADVKVDR